MGNGARELPHRELERGGEESGTAHPRTAAGRQPGGRGPLPAGRDLLRPEEPVAGHPGIPPGLGRPELDPSYGQSALATYQELLNRYPTSPAAARGKQRIADLEESFAIKEYKASQYYKKLKAYDSAVLYLRDLVATYPRTSIAPTALISLVGLYNKLGYKEDAAETCGYLRRFHPGAPQTDEVCPQAQ